MSMIFCCIKNCRTVADKNADILFHGMPEDPDTFKTYTAAIPEKIRKGIAKFCLICSKHFTEDCYEPAGRPKIEQNLKTGAVPTLFGDDYPLINNPNNEAQPDVNLPKKKNSELSAVEEFRLRKKLNNLKRDKNDLNMLMYSIKNLTKYGVAFALTKEEAILFVQEPGGVSAYSKAMAKIPSEYEESEKVLKETIDILEKLNKAMKSYLPLLLGLLNTKKTIMENNKATYLILKNMCLATDIVWKEFHDDEDDEDDELDDELYDEFAGLEEEWDELGLHLDHIRGKFDDSDDDKSDDYYSYDDEDDSDEYDEDLDDEDEGLKNDIFMMFVADVEIVKDGKNIADVEGGKKIKDDEGVKNIVHVEDVEDVKNVKNVESGKNIEDEEIKNVGGVEAVKNITDVEGDKNIKDDGGEKNIKDEVIQNVGDVEAVKNIKDDEVVKNIADVESGKNIKDDDIKNVEGVEANKNVAHDDGNKNLKDIEGVESVKNIKDEDIKNVEGVEANKDVEAVEIIEATKNSEDDEDIEDLEDEDVEDYVDEDVDDYDYDDDSDTDSCEGLTDIPFCRAGPEFLDCDSYTDEESDDSEVFNRDFRVPRKKSSYFFYSQEVCSKELTILSESVLRNPEADPESSWRDLFELERMFASASERTTASRRTGRNTKKRAENVASGRITPESLKRRAAEMKVKKGVIKQLKLDLNKVCSRDRSSIEKLRPKTKEMEHDK